MRIAAVVLVGLSVIFAASSASADDEDGNNRKKAIPYYFLAEIGKSNIVTEDWDLPPGAPGSQKTSTATEVHVQFRNPANMPDVVVAKNSAAYLVPSFDLKVTKDNDGGSSKIDFKLPLYALEQIPDARVPGGRMMSAGEFSIVYMRDEYLGKNKVAGLCIGVIDWKYYFDFGKHGGLLFEAAPFNIIVGSMQSGDYKTGTGWRPEMALTLTGKTPVGEISGKFSWNRYYAGDQATQDVATTNTVSKRLSVDQIGGTPVGLVWERESRGVGSYSHPNGKTVEANFVGVGVQKAW